MIQQERMFCANTKSKKKKKTATVSEIHQSSVHFRNSCARSFLYPTGRVSNINDDEVPADRSAAGLEDVESDMPRRSRRGERKREIRLNFYRNDDRAVLSLGNKSTRK